MAKPTSRRLARRGLTLIEVVAGTVLMALLMTQLLSVSREHARQVRAAERKEQAVLELERLLADGFRNPAAGFVLSDGTLPDLGFSWKKERVIRDLDPQLRAEVVRVSVYDVAGSADIPLTQCEILIPAAPVLRATP